MTATLHVRGWSVQANGQVRFQPAEQARPGDLIEYRAIYRNGTKAAVRHVQASLPIPPGTIYEVSGSRQEMAPLASIDGKLFEPTPLIQQVTLPNGRQQMRAVPLAHYRVLRWPLGDLPAGQSVTVTAKVRLISNELLAGQASAFGSTP